MLNKRLIVALLAVVILFLGIFSFAQSNNGDEDDKSPTTNDNKNNDKKDDDQSVTGDDTQDGVDVTVPANTTTVTRRVTNVVAVDRTLPVITLNGDEEVIIDLNQSYIDAGAMATDNASQNLNIISTGNVNTTVAGIYQIQYTTTDAAGNTAVKNRTVKVRPLIIQSANYSHEVNTPIDDNEKTKKIAATVFLGAETTISLAPENIEIVDTSAIGSYVLKYTYKYTSEAGSVDATVKYMTVSVVDTTKPEITLNKNEKGSIDLVYEVDKTNANQYVELGATLTDNYDSNSNVTEITIEQKTGDNSWTKVEKIDTSKLSEYRVKYNGKDSAGNVADEVVRSVKVVDTKAPAINLYEGDKLVLNPTVKVEGKALLDETFNTYKAYDYFDGPMFDKVIKKYFKYDEESKEWKEIANIDTKVLGKYKITYNVSDASGNKATERVRLVNVVDTQAPAINLYEGDKLVLNPTVTVEGKAVLDETFNTYRAYDYFDGQMFNKVIKKYFKYDEESKEWKEIANIDTKVLGKYKITYNVSDASGNKATEKVRLVNVVDTQAPAVNLYEGDKLVLNPTVTVEVNTKYDEAYNTYRAYDYYEGQMFAKVIKKYYKYNVLSNVWDEIASLDTSVLGQYKVTYNVSDASGNKAAEKVRLVNVVDTKAPVISSVTGNPSTWTNQDITLTVNATDNSNTLNDSAYSFDNGQTWQSSNKKTFTSNQDVTIVVRDQTGNISTPWIEKIAKIDRTNPDIQIKAAPDSLGSVIDKVFTKVSFKLHDDHLVKETSLNGTVKTYTPNSWSDFNGIKIGSAGAVYGKNILTLRDVAGNETTLEFYLDNAAPTVSIKDDSIGSITRKIFSHVNFNFSDEYKVKEFVLNGKVNTLTPGTTVDINNIKVGDEYGGVYGKNTLVLRDLVGNETTLEFYLDNVAPTITVKDESIGSKSDNVFSKVSFKLYDQYNVVSTTLNITDKQYTVSQWSDLNDVVVGSWHGGVYGKNTLVLKDLAGNEATYEFYLDNIAPTVNVVDPNKYSIEIGTPYIDKGFSAIDEIDGDLTSKVTTIYRYNNHGNWEAKPAVDTMLLGEWTVWYQVTDKAGNVSKRATRAFNVVDTTKPVVTLNEGDKTVEINTTFTDPGVVITDNSKEKLSANLTVYYSKTGADSTWVAAPGNRVDITKLGKYAIWYSAKDSSGNVSISVRRYVTVVDTTKPVVKLNEGDKTVEINTPFTDPGVVITDNSKEDLSANLTIYYSTTGADSTWVAAPDNRVDTTKLGKYAIWYSAKDSSGNVSISVRRYVTVVDTTKPEISSVGGNSVSWTNQDITLTVIATDNNKVYQYSFDNGQTWQDLNNMLFTSNQDVTIIVKDESGNVSEPYVEHITKIDKSAPTIRVQDPNQSYAPAKSFSRAVTVSDAASGLDATSMKYLWSTSRDASLPLVSTTGTTFNSGDVITTPSGVTGKYYLLIEVKDQAGNKNIYMSWGFDIDNTSPVINSVTGNSATWTNQDITLTVSANDSYPNLQYSFDNGSTWQASSSKLFTSNQDVNILVKDSSGNISNTYIERINMIDKVLPTINTVSGNPTSWVNSNVTLTVAATDNIGIYQYSFDNGSSWQSESSKSYTDNADSTIIVKDQAGNVSAAYNESITKIDKTLPTASISQWYDNAIIFQTDFDAEFPVRFTFNYNDSISGIRVAKYAFGDHGTDYFAANGTVIANTGDYLNGITNGSIYTLYAEDNAGNKTVATKTVNNIYGSDQPVTVGNLRITVSPLSGLVTKSRTITVEGLNGVSLVAFDELKSKLQYYALSDFIAVKPFKDPTMLYVNELKRQGHRYHSVYLKDSTDREYLVWIEINAD